MSFRAVTVETMPVGADIQASAVNFGSECPPQHHASGRLSLASAFASASLRPPTATPGPRAPRRLRRAERELGMTLPQPALGSAGQLLAWPVARVLSQGTEGKDRSRAAGWCPPSSGNANVVVSAASRR